ncbi:MAG: M1 family aminopeptidase [Candidatus Cloacimonadales bacterium]|nr:M1 family aminopeptidase [Candidatus Cloacimonadales bacterium]
MKKVMFVFLFFCFVFSLSANQKYPDFQKIVQKQHEFRNQEINYFRSVYEQLSEQTREMDNYDVRYYRIDIDIDFDNEYIEASNLIRFDVLENNTTAIQVHLADFLDVDEIVMNSQNLSYTHLDGIIEIDLAGTFNIGDLVELEIFYSGYPDVRLEDGIKFESHTGVPVVFSMVSPRGARKWWPCKDTPADKPDSLNIWITFPDQYICASNGLLQEEIYNGNGTKTSKWHESYPIATYLTSFAITNYQQHSFLWEYGSHQMMVDNYVYPETATPSLALYELCDGMLTFLSDTYGIFPFLNEKYGHATTTNLGAIAMEHQTCTSFDAGYISEPASEYTICHELGHSWAGDCLSIGSWSHVWLKEGFASYSEALWAEHLYGAVGLHGYMQSEDTGGALDECLYRDETLGANHIFNIVVYNKGSWTVHMLRGVLGDEDFFDLMTYYFQNPEFLYGNVVTEDLKNCAEAVAGYDMDWFFDEWFWNYGRPYYQYTYYTSAIEDSVKITLNSIGSQGDPFSMFVPFQINGEDFRTWAVDGLNYDTVYLNGNVNSLEWDTDNWVLDYGYLEKIPILEEVGENREGSAVLTWEDFFDPAIEGFNVYRKISGEDYAQLNTSPITTTYYFDDDVTAGQQYFYKIAAVFENSGNYISRFSNEISLIPVDFTFDQGILLIDGTQDYPATSPFPTDEEVDDFYDAILGTYGYTSWDVNDDGMPPLTEFAQYSTIIWHTDDIVNFPIENDFYNMKSYLLAGGNLLLSSWKLLYSLQQNFCEYYLNLVNPDTNEIPDFIGAYGQNGFPDIVIDTSKIPLAFWNNTLQYVNKSDPVGGAEPIYLYDSENNDPAWENTVCGQRFYGDFKVYVFGFPLYYMNQNTATQIVDLAMQDFGEVTNSQNNVVQNASIKLSNYPNPFNPSTTISFQLNTETAENTELIIYNLKGQKVKTFTFPNGSLGTSEQTHQINQSQNHQIVWDGTDQTEKPVSSGIYFYQLRSNDKPIATNKMILMK